MRSAVIRTEAEVGYVDDGFHDLRPSPARSAGGSVSSAWAMLAARGAREDALATVCFSCQARLAGFAIQPE